MSVATHLGIRLSEYDQRIRSFIPYYSELLRTVATVAARDLGRSATVVDLGIGTGALSARCLALIPGATLHGIDADAEILQAARRRLRRHAARATFEHRGFARVPLPPCDAIVATLSLHHIRSTAAKQRFYRRCYDALRPGGVLVSGDAFVSDDPARAADELEPWRRHMRRTYSPKEIERFLEAWGGEDRYMPTRTELRLLEKAGFEAEVAWRRPPMGVVVGRKTRE